MDSVEALLDWYKAVGVDEAIADAAIDRFAESQAMPAPVATQALLDSGRTAPPGLRPPTARYPEMGSQDMGPVSRPAAPPPHQAARLQPAMPATAGAPDAGAMADARSLAAGADSLAALRAAVASFQGCALAKTAHNLVFSDGPEDAELMLIGEAPGQEEDRTGTPFVGKSGQLLNRMLAAIGIERPKVYITNVIFWCPPFNRKPMPEERALCLPFLERHVALKRPRLIVALGGSAASALLDTTDGINRLRGRWFDYRVPGLDAPVPLMPTFHPSYLLRTPQQKREAWRDMLTIAERLKT